MEREFVNKIPVVRSIRNEDGTYPIFVEQDGTLYMLQQWRSHGKYTFYYYVDIGSAVKEFMFHTANVEPEETFVYDEPKITQDTVNLKMRDTNGDWHEMPVRSRPCANCKFYDTKINEEPCRSCNENHNLFVSSKEEPKPLTFEDIKIGDELESIVDSPIYVPTVIIVTHNCADRIYGFRKNNGAYMQLCQSDLSEWRKTGKIYSEIAKLIGGKE